MGKNKPIGFSVLDIKKGSDPDTVEVRVKFSDGEYSYIRKVKNNSWSKKYVIIDGCVVLFNDRFELLEITRLYDTNGRKRLTNGRQIEKNKKWKVVYESTDLTEDDSDGWEIDNDPRKEPIQKLDNENVSPSSEFILIDPSQDIDQDDGWKEIEKEELEEQEAEKLQEVLKGEIYHDKYDMIKTCLDCGIPVYLAGPAGSGKNYTIEQIARESGWNFYFSNSIQQEYKLTGFIDAGGDYHETEFYKACTDREESIFFLDEVDASIPDVLVLLNAAIANGYFEFPNGRVDFNKVHFVAAGNTVGSGADDMYTGRMVLDQATLDRFVIIDFDYCELIERKLTNNNEELINFVHDLRKEAQSKGIRATFSYRCMEMVTKLENADMSLEDIMRIAVMKGLDQDTINTFILSGTSRYYEAFKKIQM